MRDIHTLNENILFFTFPIEKITSIEFYNIKQNAKKTKKKKRKNKTHSHHGIIFNIYLCMYLYFTCINQHCMCNLFLYLMLLCASLFTFIFAVKKNPMK